MGYFVLLLIAARLFVVLIDFVLVYGRVVPLVCFYLVDWCVDLVWVCLDLL